MRVMEATKKVCIISSLKFSLDVVFLQQFAILVSSQSQPGAPLICTGDRRAWNPKIGLVVVRWLLLLDSLDI